MAIFLGEPNTNTNVYYCRAQLTARGDEEHQGTPGLVAWFSERGCKHFSWPMLVKIIKEGNCKYYGYMPRGEKLNTGWELITLPWLKRHKIMISVGPWSPKSSTNIAPSRALPPSLSTNSSSWQIRNLCPAHSIFPSYVVDCMKIILQTF